MCGAPKEVTPVDALQITASYKTVIEQSLVKAKEQLEKIVKAQEQTERIVARLEGQRDLIRDFETQYAQGNKPITQ